MKAEERNPMCGDLELPTCRRNMTYDLAPALPPTPTPKDYARIHFDPAQVPATRIVGLLACQRELRCLAEPPSQVGQVGQACAGAPACAPARGHQTSRRTRRPSLKAGG